MTPKAPMSAGEFRRALRRGNDKALSLDLIRVNLWALYDGAGSDTEKALLQATLHQVDYLEGLCK